MRSTMMALLLFIVALTGAANAQVQLFVPGNASGAFGSPADPVVPLVAALTVNGPGTIQVTYISGTVSDGGLEIGPNGIPWKEKGAQFPLQEAHGVAGGKVKNLDALIGVFVPQARVEREGFKAIDGTKNLTVVGIRPDDLVFIGESKTFNVTQAGTLFLGINDMIVSDNGGGFTVEVTGP